MSQAVRDLPHGTTIVAATCDYGVVLAGDRRATMGNLIAKRDLEKVYRSDDFSALGYAGAGSLGIEFARLFAVELEHYEKMEGRSLSLEGKANQLARMVRGNLGAAMLGLAVVPLFVGYDEDSGRGRIFSYDVAGGPYEEHRYYSSGPVAVRDSRRRSHADGILRDDVVLACVQARHDAADDDWATGGLTARRISPSSPRRRDGYRRLSDAEAGDVAGWWGVDGLAGRAARPAALAALDPAGARPERGQGGGERHEPHRGVERGVQARGERDGHRAVQRGAADEDREGQAAGDRPGGDQDRHREREHHPDVRERAQHARCDAERLRRAAFITTASCWPGKLARCRWFHSPAPPLPGGQPAGVDGQADHLDGQPGGGQTAPARASPPGGPRTARPPTRARRGRQSEAWIRTTARPLQVHDQQEEHGEAGRALNSEANREADMVGTRRLTAAAWAQPPALDETTVNTSP
jgi:proteasome beta subunit